MSHSHVGNVSVDPSFGSMKSTFLILGFLNISKSGPASVRLIFFLLLYIYLNYFVIHMPSPRYDDLSQTIHIYLYSFYLSKWQLESSFNMYWHYLNVWLFLDLNLKNWISKHISHKSLAFSDHSLVRSVFPHIWVVCAPITS